jgi:hypothetical protein
MTRLQRYAARRLRTGRGGGSTLDRRARSLPSATGVGALGAWTAEEVVAPLLPQAGHGSHLQLISDGSTVRVGAVSGQLLAPVVESMPGCEPTVPAPIRAVEGSHRPRINRRRPALYWRGRSIATRCSRRRRPPAFRPASSRSAADHGGRWAAAQPRRPDTRARAGSVSGSSRGIMKLVTHYDGQYGSSSPSSLRTYPALASCLHMARPLS